VIKQKSTSLPKRSKPEGAPKRGLFFLDLACGESLGYNHTPETRRLVISTVRNFLVKHLLFWVHRAKHLADAHGLDLRVFLFLSLLGYLIQGLYFLPWFRGKNVDLGLLVSLRFVGLLGPFYILLKGKKIAAVLNLSLVATWSFNTAWHVCHFVYL